MSNIILFEDIFVIDQVNPDYDKFEKALRIVARSQNCDMSMELDINSDIYPMKVNDKFNMALASTLNYDGTPDSGYYNAAKRQSLADKYEYVMQGKVYSLVEKEIGSGRSMTGEMCASFGGLLMMLLGDPSHVAHFELDQRVFLLIRKINK